MCIYVCKYLKVMIVRWEYGDSVLIMTSYLVFHHGCCRSYGQGDDVEFDN